MRWTGKNCLAAVFGLAGLLGLAAAGSAPAQFATNAAPDRLLLRDGDSLDGKLLGIDPRQVARWQHPDVAEAIEFNLDQVAEIRFHPAAPAAESSCKVFLAGGDMLEGSLVSYDRTNLSLQTWYAGQLKIPRKNLQSVYFPPSAPDIFSLTAPDGWTQGVVAGAFVGDASNWEYRAGAFYAAKSASIARDIKLPDSADVQFDMAWSGSLSLSLALYTDSLQPLLLSEKDLAPRFGGFYSLQFLPGLYVNLERVKQKEPRASLGTPVGVPTFGQTNRVRIEVRASKKANVIALSVDGVPVEVWHDTNGFAGEGTGIRFVHNPAGLIKISDLRVTPWDGVLPEAGQSNAVPAGQDIVSLTNGAALAGQIMEVARGAVTLRGTAETNVVPLSQAHRLTFAGPKEEVDSDQPGTARATLVDGGSLEFHLERWGPEGVDIRSAAFGVARFSPESFLRVVFAPAAGAVNGAK